MLVANPRGNYSFVKGISPYSAGAVASPGYAIEHARFLKPIPLQSGFAAVEAHLKRINRPKQALCAMELRSPKPFTFTGFSQFNAGYVEVLKAWDILQDGLNPVARTNIAPAVNPPAEPSLYAFSYTVPTPNVPKTFIVAGAGELPEGSLDPKDVVKLGDLSPAGLTEKIKFVMGLMEGRLQGLGVSWNEATVTEVYTVHNIHAFLSKEIVGRMKLGGAHGITWHYSRPPIETIEYEMDVRGIRHEIVL
jgi:hypothetical protein